VLSLSPLERAVVAGARPLRNDAPLVLLAHKLVSFREETSLLRRLPIRCSGGNRKRERAAVPPGPAAIRRNMPSVRKKEQSPSQLANL